MTRPRRKLLPADVTAIIDTREKAPLDLAPLKVVRATLPTADYSVVGLEHVVAIERKSLSDLVGCVGASRERFDACIQRMLGYQVRAVVVEATWEQLELGGWRGVVTPGHVVGSVLGWIGQGIPFVLAGTRERAGLYVSRMLFIAARRRWQEAQAFVEGLTIAPAASEPAPAVHERADQAEAV